MNLLKWFAPHRALAVCDHRYCYRDIHCTLCGKPYEGPGEPEFTPHIIRDGKPVPAHEENGVLVPDDLDRFLAAVHEAKDEPLKCPYCGGTKFFEGPSGGMSNNILCANSECRHWFNYHGGIMPMDDLHRVEPTEAEKAAQAQRREQEKDDALAARLRQGMEFYRENHNTALMRLAQREEKWTSPKHEHIDQLCGFIDAMCDDLRTLIDQRFEQGPYWHCPLHRTEPMLHNRMTGKIECVICHRSNQDPKPSLPAYGPGSITDAASYTDEAIKEAQRQHDRGREIQAAARFAAFLDGYPGHPAEAFKAYMEQVGKPLTADELKAFETEYHKEE